MDLILEVEGLHVDLPLPAGRLQAVRDVTFDLRQGETLSLVGESGCGKSLTALALMNLLPPRARRRARKLVFEGCNLSRASEKTMAELRGDRMAMIFQEPMTSLNPCYTIGNQLVEAYRQHRQAPRREARERAVFLLEKVGITAAGSRLKQFPHQLSGGIRQRIMIAMGLMCGPSLIIADEPTTALDVTIQAQILALLVDLQREFQMGLILITHDLGVVARVAHRLCVMYCGQVVETGTTLEVFTRPLHPYTQGLLRCIPVPGKVEPGSELGSIPGLVPTPIGVLKGCMFRNRCPKSRPECAAEDQPLRGIGPGRALRCVDIPTAAD
ncbi:MAG: ABC transporter ATP-binding protein [Hyphomicrobiales bacterium]